MRRWEGKGFCHGSPPPRNDPWESSVADNFSWSWLGGKSALEMLVCALSLRRSRVPVRVREFFPPCSVNEKKGVFARRGWKGNLDTVAFSREQSGRGSLFLCLGEGSPPRFPFPRSPGVDRRPPVCPRACPATSSQAEEASGRLNGGGSRGREAITTCPQADDRKWEATRLAFVVPTSSLSEFSRCFRQSKPRWSSVELKPVSFTD